MKYVEQKIRKLFEDGIDSFFEYIEEDFAIICKIDNFHEEGKIEIFDIAKEILKVNRSVRRNMLGEQLKNVIIYEEAPLLKVIPLIIDSKTESRINPRLFAFII